METVSSTISNTASTAEVNATLIAKIDSIESVMLTAHPRLPYLMREIHKILADDPAVVTLLSEEQIGEIVKGLAAHTNVELAASTIKKTTKKPLKSITVDDL